MPPKPIRILANAQSVIDTLAKLGPLTPTELAEHVNIPRSSAYRLVDGLHAAGMTTLDEDSRVRLSLRWLHLSDSTRANMTEWRNAHHILDSLAANTSMTAYLSIAHNDGVVCLDWAQGHGVGLLALRPGRELPLNAGAAGRVILAFGTAEDPITPTEHRALTKNTITGTEELRFDAARIRQLGYALSTEDVTIGIGAIGVPIFNQSGTLAGALSIAGLIEDIQATQNHAIPQLLEAATHLAPII